MKQDQQASTIGSGRKAIKKRPSREIIKKRVYKKKPKRKLVSANC